MKPTVFWVFSVDDKFVCVDENLGFILTKEIVSYWTDKRIINGWKSDILRKYPNAEIKQAKMVLK